MGFSLTSYISYSAATRLGVSFFGRPPIRPHALAASSPAWVRSRISFRSKSAMAPKIWETMWPVEEGVSGLLQAPEADGALLEPVDGAD